MKYILSSMLTLALVLTSTNVETAQAKRFSPGNAGDASRIIVLYEDAQHMDDQNRVSRIGVESVPSGQSMSDRIAEIRSRRGVVTAAPNFMRGVTEIEPNDIDTNPEAQYPQQTKATGNVKATKAWTVHKGKGSIIAVIDTGVDTDHEDLKKKIWKNEDEIANNGIDDDNNGFVDDRRGWDFYHNDNNPSPSECTHTGSDVISHGSHVAGLAAARTDNDKGVAGIGWKSKIMALQVSGCDGLMPDENIARAIQYAVANGADVINMSLGGIGESAVMQEVIADAIDAGVLVVAAAGNERINIDRIPYEPAGIDGVITVAATDSSDDAAGFSNFGSNTVDIAAPGVDLLSALYHDDSDAYKTKYGVYSGTSMASPVVAGALALMKAQDSSVTQAEARAYLEESADDVGLSNKYGPGRLNTVKLMLQLKSVKKVHIKAFNNDSRSKKYKRGSTQKDRTPYFRWVVPTQLKENIKEYCWYFGTNKEADPFKKGKCKQKPKKQIDKLPKAKNGKTYYLRVGMRKADGTKYGSTGTFKYILKTE